MRALILAAGTLFAVAAHAQAPDITVTPDDFSFELNVGEETSRAVLIENSGDAALSFRIQTVSAQSTSPVVYALDQYSQTLYGVDPRSGQTLSQATVSVSGWLAFDGRALYVLSGTTLVTLDPETGASLGTVDLQDPSSSYAHDIAVLAGNVAVAVVGSPNRVDVYDPATGALLSTIPTGFEPRTVAGGDGVLYVSGYDSQAGEVVATFDAATGERLRTAAFPEVASLTYSRALDAFLTLGPYSQTVRIYDATTGTYLSSVTLPTQYPYSSYNRIAADEGAEAAWLSVSPRQGTVGVGAQVGATVRVDAGRVVGGTYEADVLITSTDLDEPEVVIPVRLVAIGVPDVAVAPSSVDFGMAYVGTPVTRAVVVGNPGSDTLRVGGAAVSDDRLAVASGSFDVLPGDSLALLLTVTPTGEGPLNATLTLTTNVPGAETVEVPVTATDVFPPVLAVTPDSLSVSSEAGEVATATLTVANEGQGPLAYTVTSGLTASVIPSRESALGRRAAPTPEEVRQRFQTAQASRQSARKTAQPAAGVDAPRLTVFVTDEEADRTLDLRTVRGAVTGDSLYIELDFQHLPEELYYGVLIDLDTNPNTGWNYYGLGFEVELYGQVYQNYYGDAPYGWVDVHTVSQGNLYSGSSVEVDGGTVTFSVPTRALPGLGRAFDLTVFASGQVYNGSYWEWGEDIAPNDGIVAVEVAPWLSSASESGELAAGASTEVALTLDATRLLDGVYEGTVVVEGNGPEPQVETVAVVFDVVGTPAAEAAPIAFGTVFVGYAAGQTLMVTNSGTADLELSAVESDEASVAVSLDEALVLRPGGTVALPVSLTATEVGAVAASLSFTTNLPEPLTVAVTAEAVERPVAAMTPADLRVEVTTGEQAEATVALANSGGSPLTYRTRVAARSAATSARRGDVGGSAEGLSQDVGPTLAAAREAASRRAGVRAVASAAPLVADLPTLLIDPAEGGAADLVEVRGLFPDDSGPLSLELVFAQPVNANGLVGSLHIDIDSDVSTGNGVYLDTYRELGADITVDLYNVRYGEAYIYQNVSPYNSRYAAVTVDGRSLRIDIPRSYMVDGSFAFAGYTYDNEWGGETEYFPNTGVARVDAQLEWIEMASEEGAVPAGETLEMDVRFDAASLSVGTYEALVQVATNDPEAPVLQVPVTLSVVGNSPVAGGPDAFAFGLAPPSPNPTRGAARMGYTLAEGAPVTVEVFDAVGRRVAFVDEGARGAGQYTLNLETSTLPAGVYSVRLRAGGEVAVQRLSVVR